LKTATKTRNVEALINEEILRAFVASWRSRSFGLGSLRLEPDSEEHV